MINKINNSYVEKYKNISINTGKTGDSKSEFKFDFEKEGVIFEPNKGIIKENKEPVVLELSVQKKNEEKKDDIEKETKIENENRKEGIINDTLRVFVFLKNSINNIIKTIKDAFTPGLDSMETKKDKEEITAEYKFLDEKKYSEDDIKKIIKSGDIEEISKVVTEDGKKIPARNTSLVTIYNKKGHKSVMSVDLREEGLLKGEKNDNEKYYKRI